MCKKHYLTKEQKFPKRGEEITEFYNHLIFDDEKKAIYCFVPKVSEYFRAHTNLNLNIFSGAP